MNKDRSSHRPYIPKHSRGDCTQLKTALNSGYFLSLSPSHVAHPCQHIFMTIPTVQVQTLRDLEGRKVGSCSPIACLRDPISVLEPSQAF